MPKPPPVKPPQRQPTPGRQQARKLIGRRKCCKACLAATGTVIWDESDRPHPRCDCPTEPIQMERTRVVKKVDLVERHEKTDSYRWVPICYCGTGSNPATGTWGKKVRLFEIPNAWDSYHGKQDVLDKIKAEGWKPHREVDEDGRERDSVYHEIPAGKCLDFTYAVKILMFGWIATIEYTAYDIETGNELFTWEEKEPAVYKHWVSMDLLEAETKVTSCDVAKPTKWKE